MQVSRQQLVGALLLLLLFVILVWWKYLRLALS
jgi:hypothetical protein